MNPALSIQRSMTKRALPVLTWAYMVIVCIFLVTLGSKELWQLAVVFGFGSITTSCAWNGSLGSMRQNKPRTANKDLTLRKLSVTSYQHIHKTHRMLTYSKTLRNSLHNVPALYRHHWNVVKLCMCVCYSSLKSLWAEILHQSTAWVKDSETSFHQG